MILANGTSHLIQVDDDFNQSKSICSCGLVIFDGHNRAKKMAASYRHLADVLDPPEIETVGTPA
jgi:hypothetical protein